MINALQIIIVGIKTQYSYILYIWGVKQNSQNSQYSTVQYINFFLFVFRFSNTVINMGSLAFCSTWAAGKQKGLLTKTQYFNILIKQGMCVSAAYGKMESQSGTLNK